MDAGRKKIARAGTMLENRAAGFRDAFRARGRRPARRALYPTDGLEFADGYRIGPALLRDGVDGVFFDTDRLALGFLKFARERGVRVPGDVAVIGFDDDPAGQYVCPALSTVAHPIEDMSRTLAQWIETETGGRKRRVFPTRFVRRESV